MVSPNSRDSGNLYPIYPLFPCSDFFIPREGVWGVGGEVSKISFRVFSRFMLFPTFLEKQLLVGGGGQISLNRGINMRVGEVRGASEPVGGRSRVTELPCSY